VGSEPDPSRGGSGDRLGLQMRFSRWRGRWGLGAVAVLGLCAAAVGSEPQQAQQEAGAAFKSYLRAGVGSVGEVHRALVGEDLGSIISVLTRTNLSKPPGPLALTPDQKVRPDCPTGVLGSISGAGVMTGVMSWPAAERLHGHGREPQGPKSRRGWGTIRDPGAEERCTGMRPTPVVLGSHTRMEEWPLYADAGGWHTHTFMAEGMTVVRVSLLCAQDQRGNVVQYFAGLQSITVSPDGQNVYAVGTSVMPAVGGERGLAV
jgi:hypothetical protein